jgi:uncharacterized small protein (DUF1192 family)
MSRYTVEEAAAVLGMTTGAVRNRLSQGTLRSVEEHGTVYVLLPADTSSRGAAQDTGDIPGESSDTVPGTGDIPGMSSALMSEMRDRIAFLERELEGAGALVSEMRDRIAFLERELEGKDAILLNIAEAVKDISPPAQEEAPRESREAPGTTATEQPGRIGPRREQPLEGAMTEPAQPRRSWWSRIFGA